MGFEGCSRPVVAVHTLGKRAPPTMLVVAYEVNNRRHQVVEAGRWQLEVLTVEPDVADSGVR